MKDRQKTTHTPDRSRRLVKCRIDENEGSRLEIDEIANREVERLLKGKRSIDRYTIPQSSKDYVTNIVIPDSVIHIENYAFADCKNLQSIVIPDSVTSIGYYVFCQCRNLRSIVIPDSVTSIGYYVFCQCRNLQSVVIPDSVTSIGIGAFKYCDKLKSVTIPDSVVYIGDSAFDECESLQSVVIPDSVTSIGKEVFYQCESLQSIVIPDSVTSIGNSAFGVCKSLESVVIPDSVTSIGDYAFYWCRSLQSLVIPDSVTSIGDNAFKDCLDLESIVLPEKFKDDGERLGLPDSCEIRTSKSAQVSENAKITITLEQLRRLVKESASDFSDPAGPDKLPADPEELDYYWFKNELWEELNWDFYQFIWNAPKKLNRLIGREGLFQYGWESWVGDEFMLAVNVDGKTYRNMAKFNSLDSQSDRKCGASLYKEGGRDRPTWGFLWGSLTDTAYKRVFDFDDSIVRPIYERLRERHPGNIHDVCNDMAVKAVEERSDELVKAVRFSGTFAEWCRQLSKAIPAVRQETKTKPMTSSRQAFSQRGVK